MAKEPGIEDLPGVGAATAEKLISGGFDNLMAIAVATPAEVVNASGVTETAARKIIHAARASMDMGFQSGDELLQKRSRVIKISSGSKILMKCLRVALKRALLQSVLVNMEVQKLN